MPAIRRMLAPALAVAALAGCGDGGDADSPSPAATTETAPPAPKTTETEEDRPKPRREDRSLADCLRAAPGVEAVLEKGADSEDSRYFQELAGERPRVFAITVEGVSAEVDAFVFESRAAAQEAAPGAGGSGFAVGLHGTSLLVAPTSAGNTIGIERCLREDAT